MSDEKQRHWLTRPETIRKFWIYGVLLLGALAIGGHFVPSHPHFAIENSFAFYAWYGFGTCVLMVLFAKVLGIFLKRRDDYYDD
ncbi:MAG: hypothetical protein O2912_02995 [Proteobacteria bacterium]|nr:hypothetical protein [Pseudomonadota bacterium]